MICKNRLGYVTNVARRLAELRGEREKAALLATEESRLERSRLAREDTLCHESLTEVEKVAAKEPSAGSQTLATFDGP